MEEQREQREVNALTVGLSLIASVLLSRLSLGVFVYPVPVLLVSYRFKRTRDAVTLQAAAVAATLLWSIVSQIGYIGGANAGRFVIGTYFLLATGLTALVYTALRDYSNSVLRKLVITSAMLMVLGGAVATWLSLPAGAEAAEGIRSDFAQLMGVLFSDLRIDTEMLANWALALQKAIIVPLSMVFASVPVLFTEGGAHRFDSEWQDGFASMKMPTKYFWYYCVFLAAVVAGYLLKSDVVFLLGINLALGMSLHYMMNGISILHALIRRKVPAFPAGTLVYLLFFVSFIPALDVLVWAALLLSGVLENWVRMR